jgi:phosphatidylserine/phosphatidylglycerophosphate/cardiolipin synthase-like enzyme
MPQYWGGMSKYEPGTTDLSRPRLRVLVQPDDGVEAVVSLIAEARHTILLKMFTFTSMILVEALFSAVARGVAVRVLLNPRRSSGTRANDEVFERLGAGGVTCEWTTAFVVTHEKSMVIDDRLTLIATFNFCDKYFTHTRDYGLVVDDAEIAQEVSACFEADWESRRFAPSHPRLLWSNATSRRGICEIIDNAERSLILQHPKFSDVTVLDRLLHAQDRGVRVKVLCGGRHGISDSDILDTFSALRALRRAGVKVNKQRGLRMHAKLIVADGQRALVGSMNIDRSAFDLRRELGMIVEGADLLRPLARTFHSDWEESSRYHAPDPMGEEMTAELDHPHDPELVHE